MRARKRFGQNFLHDQNLIRKIVRAINPQPNQHIVEIGPGRGAITDLVLQSGCKLDVIEIDRDLAQQLRVRHPDLNVIEADVLKFDFNSIERAGPVRVIGNLPYNISTPLLFKLFKDANMILDMHFMLQLEVVDRMTAAHSTSDYGRLSVMSQYYCSSEKLFSVPPDAFVPQPKVMSAIIRLAPKTESKLETNVPMLEKVVLQVFSMRRKTIRNALKGIVTEDEIRGLGLDPRSRPENLSLENYAAIASFSASQHA